MVRCDNHSSISNRNTQPKEPGIAIEHDYDFVTAGESKFLFSSSFYCSWLEEGHLRVMPGLTLQMHDLYFTSTIYML